jgi:hypothetical protein
MRYALIAFAVVLFTGTALAQDYTTSGYCAPWCLLGPRSGGLDCSYYTYNQCLATRSGVGGSCEVNPFLSQCRRAPERPVRRVPRHRHD